MADSRRNFGSRCGLLAAYAAFGAVLGVACQDSYELSLGTLPDAAAAPCSGDGCRDSGRSCDRSADACGECQDDRDCDREDQPVCDPASRRCVRCLSDTDCSDERTCNALWHRCVEACAQREDCSDRDRPFCERDQSACVECLEDADCRGNCVRGVCE